LGDEATIRLEGPVLRIPGRDNNLDLFAVGDKTALVISGPRLYKDCPMQMEIWIKPCSKLDRHYRLLQTFLNLDAWEKILDARNDYDNVELNLRQGLAEISMKTGDWAEAVRRWQFVIDKHGTDTPEHVYSRLDQAYRNVKSFPRGMLKEEKVKGEKDYLEFLAQIHSQLEPKLYLEIGVHTGKSLILAGCRAIGVDPMPQLKVDLTEQAEVLKMTSDDFFKKAAPDYLKQPPDLVFIDGMHLFEYALRDFMNVERYSAPNTLVVMDDIFPNHPAQAERVRRTSAWTGDVWKVYDILRKYRPDLYFLSVNTSPTGLLLIAGLKSENQILWKNYEKIVEEYSGDFKPPDIIINREGVLSTKQEVLSILPKVVTRKGRDELDSQKVCHNKKVKNNNRPQNDPKNESLSLYPPPSLNNPIINFENLTVGIGIIKNEEDILEAFVRHNLYYLDFLLLADNDSSDNSRAIINKLMQEGLNVCVFDYSKQSFNQGYMTTNLYKRVATTFFPEFILPLDADEFIQASSKEAFINSIKVIPVDGIGLYPWKTYIPDPYMQNCQPENFRYKRKKEIPEYFKVIIRQSKSTDYSLKLCDGNHGIQNKKVKTKLSDIWLAHFPVRNVDQIYKKAIFGYLGYLALYQDVPPRKIAYQKQDLYKKIMNGESFKKNELTYLALNYAQKTKISHDWQNHVVESQPIIKSNKSNFQDFGQNENNNTIKTVCKSMEKLIIKNDSILKESKFYNIKNDYKLDNANLTDEVFIDVPPFQYLYERFKPQSVLDLGCAAGAYLHLFDKLGTNEVMGIDNFIPRASFIEKHQYKIKALNENLELNNKYDMVLCLDMQRMLTLYEERKLFETINRHSSEVLVLSVPVDVEDVYKHTTARSFKGWAKFFHDQGWHPMLTETLFLRCISSFSWFRKNLIVLERSSNSSDRPLGHGKQWEKLIELSKLPYRWHSRGPQIVFQVLDKDIPDNIFGFFDVDCGNMS